MHYYQQNENLILYISRLTVKFTIKNGKHSNDLICLCLFIVKSKLPVCPSRQVAFSRPFSANPFLISPASKKLKKNWYE